MVRRLQEDATTKIRHLPWGTNEFFDSLSKRMSRYSLFAYPALHILLNCVILISA